MMKGRGIEYEVKTRRIRYSTIVARAGENMSCALLRTLAEQQHGLGRLMMERQGSGTQRHSSRGRGRGIVAGVVEAAGGFVGVLARAWLSRRGMRKQGGGQTRSKKEERGDDAGAGAWEVRSPCSGRQQSRLRERG